MYYSAVLRDIKDYIIWQLGYSVIKKFIKRVFSKSSGNYIVATTFLFLKLGISDPKPKTPF